MNIIIALVMFGILVAIHEFGHFAVAKLSGIKVNKFAIGMGPVIFKFTKGETEYSLRLFPVGGYCAMEGEDESSDDSRAFRNKPVKNRIGVVIAGIIITPNGLPECTGLSLALIRDLRHVCSKGGIAFFFRRKGQSGGFLHFKAHHPGELFKVCGVHNVRAWIQDFRRLLGLTAQQSRQRQHTDQQNDKAGGNGKIFLDGGKLHGLFPSRFRQISFPEVVQDALTHLVRDLDSIHDLVIPFLQSRTPPSAVP